jgi:Tyrosine-protein kinase ephrin type A/B receptor-like/Cation-independent mannose-6-phosphate receptor repeat
MQQVAGGTDSLARRFKSFLNYDTLPTQCAAKLGELSCSLCSPVQDQFVGYSNYESRRRRSSENQENQENRRDDENNNNDQEWTTMNVDVDVDERSVDLRSILPTSADYLLCENMCNALYSACETAKLVASGATVAHSVRSAREFCTALLSGADGQSGSVALSWRALVNDGQSKWLDRSRCFSTLFDEGCSSRDWLAHYSACEGEQKNVYYSWRDGTTCQGGLALPKTLEDVPCDLSCEPGEYLPIGDDECKSCEPGEFSVGGGYRVSVWKTWPQGVPFRSYCTSHQGSSSDDFGTVAAEGFDKGCSWQLEDTRIVSGALNHSMSSVLELRPFLVRAGSVRFDFRVDSEPYFDGLHFYVDEVRVLSAEQNVEEWRQFEAPLSAGVHVLRWVYFKDWSHSVGDDAAMLDLVEVVGTTWADEQCTACPPGTFSGAKARQCTECPAHTYSGHATSRCTECAADEYSYPGALGCTMRAPCTEDDYEPLFGACHANAAPGAEPSRQLRYAWLEPKICDSSALALPASQEVDCAPCNAGHFRSGVSCAPCPSGRHSASSASTCVPCPAGTAAVRTLYYTEFDEWLPGLSAHCTSVECATSTGWRLLSNSLDSGVGHGVPSDSVLRLHVELDRPGSVKFQHQLDCDTLCQFQFRVANEYTHTFYGGSWSVEPVYFSVELDAGEHDLEWIFTKYDPSNAARNDRARIFSILVVGTVTGGAIECTPCAGGTFARAESDRCPPCPPGKLSGAGASECDECPGDTFQPDEGATSCLPCGHDTTHTFDHRACSTNHCHYAPLTSSSLPQPPPADAPASLVYDLQRLQRDVNMYGPVYDRNDHTYYLNVCTNQHSNHSCHDRAGAPILSYACQITNQQVGKNLGSVMGYYPLMNDLSSGLVVSYTLGDEACASAYGAPVARETNVTFHCDPLAGVGYPAPVEPVEHAPCRYQFTWVSLYACPLCTIDSYYPILSECIDGNQTRTYLPVQQPSRCHGGLALPEPTVTVGCVASPYACPPGQFLESPGGVGGPPVCRDARPGFYTIGGGEAYADFPPLGAGESLDDYRWPSSSMAGDWLPYGHYVGSGPGESTLELRVNLVDVVDANAVQFRFKAYAVGSEAPTDGFEFFIDGVSRTGLVQSTMFAYSTFSLADSLDIGPHVLRWTFRGGEPSSDGRRLKGALVADIVVRGTSHAARHETPCPPGTFSAVVGASSCSACPEDTYAPGGSTQCTPCPDANFYALPGSPTCTLRPVCQADDYSVSFGECHNGRRSRSYAALAPKVCRDDPNVYSPPRASGDFECAPCPPGKARLPGSDSCSGCAAGHALPASVDQDPDAPCEPAPAGSYAPPISSHFIDDSLSAWPLGFSTACSGECGSDGWRVRGGAGIDSGFHHEGEVDSRLLLENVAVVSQSAYVQFEYRVTSDSPQNGLDFFVNDVQQHFSVSASAARAAGIADGEEDDGEPWLQTRFALAPGAYTFMWTFHQERGTGHARADMRAIEVLGDAAGTAVRALPCPPGSFSPSIGQVSCEPCAAGKVAAGGASACAFCEAGVAEHSGMSTCEPCGDGTFSSDTHERCVTNNCLFSLDSGKSAREYNLRSLRSGASAALRFDAVAPRAVGGGGAELRLSLCDWLAGNATCSRADGSPMDTHACLKPQSSSALDVGHRLKASPFDAAGEESYGIRLEYTDGDLCRGGTHYSVDVRVYCYDDAAHPVMPPTVTLDDCTYHIEWYTLSGCRACTAADYKEVKSTCEDGRHVVDHVRDAECNGPPISQQTTGSCSAEYDFPLWVIVAVIAGFALLGGVVAFVFWRHRSLSQQYELLVNDDRFTQPREDDGPGGGTELEISSADDASIVANDQLDRESI